jgi:hypothetical protein
MIAAKDPASQYCGNTQSNEGSRHILTGSAGGRQQPRLRSSTRMWRVSSVKAAEHVRGRMEDAREATRAITRHDTRAWVQIRYQLRGQGMN